MSATLSNVFKLPFQEQIYFFRQKINLPTERYDDITGAAHDRMFVVAGAKTADLVDDLRKTIDQSIAEGKSLGWYRKNWEAITAKHGWTDYTGHESQARRDWRTRVTYQTNMSVSYAAGRWEQLHDPDLVMMMPYLTYVHHDNRHPRPIHVSWNGFTAPRDHDFWKTHAVPNDHFCHCSLEAADEADYAKAKASGKHEPPAGWDKIDPKTGEQVGIGKGFGYAPGASVKRPMRDFIAQKLINLDAPIGAAMWEKLKPVLEAEQNSAFKDFFAQPSGQFVIAVLNEKMVSRIQSKTAAVQISAETMVKQTREHSELSADEYRFVQTSLDVGEVIEDERGALIFINEADGYVSVVKATRSGNAVFLTSFRRLSSQEAKRDAEIRRLRDKAAGGGASHPLN